MKSSKKESLKITQGSRDSDNSKENSSIRKDTKSFTMNDS